MCNLEAKAELHQIAETLATQATELEQVEVPNPRAPIGDA
jgi:hypothetical protein